MFHFTLRHSVNMNSNSNVYGAIITAQPLREFIQFISWMHISADSR